MPQAITLPRRLHTTDGSVRRVGVELEYADLDAPAAARAIQALYGGVITLESPHRARVRDTRLGDFAVELDMRSAHPGGGQDGVAGQLHALWGRIGSLVMPFEIASPPIPIPQLSELEALVERLAALGASGTQASPLFAFGLHFNPEVAEAGIAYVLDHLKAFLLLAPWLRQSIGVDPTRRLSGFVKAFPTEYVSRVVDPAYRPDLPTLIADYLDTNPTRNRELDLCPLFAHLAPDLLFDRVRDKRVRPRPTFHYRLPDARIGAPGFSLAADWNRWVAVEELAADRTALDRLGAAFRARAAAGTVEGWATAVGALRAAPAAGDGSWPVAR